MLPPHILAEDEDDIDDEPLTDDDYKQHVELSALTYLRDELGIRAHCYRLGLRNGAKDALLPAFCRSPRYDSEEDDFFVDNVRPDLPENLRKIRAFGKLLGINENPKWYIPDEAMPVEEIISELPVVCSMTYKI